jgi:hypothetical protein
MSSKEFATSYKQITSLKVVERTGSLRAKRKEIELAVSAIRVVEKSHEIFFDKVYIWMKL